jgi:hypothetical protein
MKKSLGVLFFILSMHATSFGMSRGPALAKQYGLVSQERLALEMEKAALIKELEDKEAEIERNYKQEFFALGSGNAEAFFEKQGPILEKLEKEKDRAEQYYQKKVDALVQKEMQQAIARKEAINRNQLFNEALVAISNNANKRALQNIFLKINEQCSSEELKKYIFELANAAEDYNNEIASELIEQIFFEKD